MEAGYWETKARTLERFALKGLLDGGSREERRGFSCLSLSFSSQPVEWYRRSTQLDHGGGLILPLALNLPHILQTPSSVGAVKEDSEAS